jgi:plastin-1
LCRSKLLNSSMPDSIDERALNLPLPEAGGPPLQRREALQNNALCINAAKALGCSLANLTPEDVVDGKVGAPAFPDAGPVA